MADPSRAHSSRPRTSKSGEAPPPLDWAAIEKQLNGIPPDFKSQRFNSLKRVIEILSRDKPQWALAELQQELHKCEGVIDAVVDAHHLGFNHAIENYSKILSLFNECKAQVATLCGNFDESRTRVGAVSSNLRVQWQTSMALQGSISILKDVQSAVATHAELERVMKLGKWTACVPLLLRLANNLSIEELSKHGALSEIRGSLHGMHDNIVAALIRQVIAQLSAAFSRTSAGFRLSIEELSKLGALSEIRGSLHGMYDTIVAALIRQVIALTFQRPAAAQALVSGATGPGGGGSSTVDRDREVAVRAPVGHHPRIAALLAEQQDAAVLHATGVGGALDLGGEQAGDEQVRQLVACLVQLDALTPLRQHVVPATGRQVHLLMERTLATIRVHSAADADRDLHPSSSRSSFVPAAAAPRVASAVLLLLSALLLVMHNNKKLFDAIAQAGPRLAAARRLDGRAIRLVRGAAEPGPEDGTRVFEEEEPEGKLAGRLQGAAAQDLVAVWGSVQKEVVGMLACLIKAPFVQTNAAQASAAVASSGGTDSPSSSGWLGNLLNADPSGNKNARPPRLNFRFEASIAISPPLTSAATGTTSTAAAAEGAIPPPAADSIQATHDYKDLVETLLRRTAPPSPYLATLVYTPTAQFARQCCGVLPQPAIAAPGGRDMLQMFIDNFVGESLLPRVLQDCKTAAAGILQHKQAFSTSTAVTSTAHADTFVLQAASVKIVTKLASIVNVLMHVVISVSANSTRFATCPTPTTASGTMHARTLSTAMSSAARGGTHVGMGSLGDAPTPAPAAADVPSLLPQLRSLLPGLNANTRVQAAAAAALSRTLADPATEPPAALAQLVKQMRLTAGRCLCAIRLHVIVMVATTMDAVVAQGRHAVASGGGRERDPALQALLRSMHRVEEELRPYLSSAQLLFVVADAPRVAYRLVMWNVPLVQSINNAGIERLLQWLQLIKGSLTVITNLQHASPAMRSYSTSASEAALDACQIFLRLLQGHPNNIVLEATRPKKRRKLSKIEWLSLLAVNVEGRSVSKQQRNHLQQALESDDAQNCVRPLQAAELEQLNSGVGVRERIATMLSVPFHSGAR